MFRPVFLKVALMSVCAILASADLAVAQDLNPQPLPPQKKEKITAKVRTDINTVKARPRSRLRRRPVAQTGLNRLNPQPLPPAPVTGAKPVAH